HFHPQVVSYLVHCLSGRHAFDDLLDVGLSFFDALAAGERKSHAAIPRQVVGAGEEKVAHACETGKGVRLGAERYAQTRHLRESTVDESYPGVGAEAEPVGDTGPDGEHVLDGSADLYADDVGRRVRAEVRAGEGSCQIVGESI